ncbi:hypothetical protein CCAX7_49730 [Capsulimonas corticalis]|uniref:Uncharacterized protein n=1 Tax=Capsulimonas corticalis TaxID=2219043 RepID=A0A402CPK3_9BACT|nr:hypothetical protein [Capsulimonas corticalis]BDI32922.1 hypothetical protein CCAX7_49730 [Capsulimonas corticalis]
MMRFHREAYQQMLASMTYEDLGPLYRRTADEYPVLARAIADEIARRESAWTRQFLSPETVLPELAAAA